MSNADNEEHQELETDIEKKTKLEEDLEIMRNEDLNRIKALVNQMSGLSNEISHSMVRTNGAVSNLAINLSETKEAMKNTEEQTRIKIESIESGYSSKVKCAGILTIAIFIAIIVLYRKWTN